MSYKYCKPHSILETRHLNHDQVHLPLSPALASSSESLHWEPWSGSLMPSQNALASKAAPPRGLQLEVTKSVPTRHSAGQEGLLSMHIFVKL